MTYAAGFRTEHGIYLTVDTATTGEKNTAAHSDTFFGEQAMHDSFDINDNAMKLFQLDTNRIVAAAGDAAEIYKAIEFLREHTKTFTRPHDLFESIESSLSIPRDAIQFIFAEYSQEGFELGIWKSGDKYISPCDLEGQLASAISTGSGMEFSYLTDNVAQSIQSITDKTINNNLAFISCCHQLNGVHANHTLKNVGGAFVTVALTKDGIIWQPDITYFKYSPSFMKKSDSSKEQLKMFYPINVFVRDGVVFVERRVPEHRAIWMDNAVDEDKSKKIREMYQTEIEDIALNLSCEYGAFLSSDKPSAVLIHNFEKDYYYKNTISQKTAQTTYSKDVYKVLLDKPELNNKQGSMNILCIPNDFLQPNYFTNLKKREDSNA